MALGHPAYSEPMRPLLFDGPFDLLKRAEGGFDLVFSDVVLPGMSGVRLADKLLAEDPDSRILLCSGYADRRSQWSLISERGLPFLGKPYSVVDLLKTVNGIIH